MTPQEVIKQIEDVLSSTVHYDETIDYQLTTDDVDWIENAKSALEKQIPKKPKGKTDPMFGDTTIVCPNCGNANLANLFDISRVYDYCPNCGQALDWETQNEI